METHQVQAPGPERKALQSWKEIAAFLNVTVRTVPEVGKIRPN